MNKRIDNYSIMIASKYFERIDDFINVEIGVKRFEGNMERFHFNPIPLNDTSRKLFTNLETLHLYDENDQIFQDGRIFKQCIWYYVDYEEYLKEEEKGNDCKYWKNNIDHKGILERKNIIDLNEMKQIESWSGMKIGNIIFDSNVDNWKVNTTVFDEKVINKSNLIFLIEDDDGNKFGGYINTKIDKYHSWIKDSKSFLFSLKSNGRLNGMFKFEIPKKSKNAFRLCNQSNVCLLAIGGGIDIGICKLENRNESCCCQEAFNYNGIENALCGSDSFIPKRITVIQLNHGIENSKEDKMKQEFKSEKLKEGDELKRKEKELRQKQEKMEKKEKELIKRKEEINIFKTRELEFMEEWTGMKMGDIMFDSDKDDWDVDTSVLHERIMNKSNLIFIIEDGDDNKFGGYINAIIDKYDSYINDPKSFVFSLKSNGRLDGMFKFDIKDPQYSFAVDAQTSNSYLFLLGYNGGYDIWIHKENNKTQSYCSQQSSYNYNGIQNALCGKREFTPKRITVIQSI